jgi:hypothetical protein
MGLLLFISSTSDLKAERQALAESLRPTYEPFLYEELGAGGVPPEEVIKKKIENSDVFIGLLGPRYGSPYSPPGDNRSIVEWEFDTARGNSALVVMPFRKCVPQDQIEPPQLKFIERISAFGKGGMWLKEFDSTQNLVKLVRDSLEGWMIVQTEKVKRRILPWLHTALMVTALASTLLCILAFVLFMAQVIPLNQSSVLGVCGLSFFTTLLVIVLFAFNRR